MQIVWSDGDEVLSLQCLSAWPLPSPPPLDDTDVILERRDDENLVLIRAERFEAGAAGFEIAARALAILARRNGDLAEEVLAEELPWITWLPETERHICVRELLANLIAAPIPESCCLSAGLSSPGAPPPSRGAIRNSRVSCRDRSRATDRMSPGQAPHDRPWRRGAASQSWTVRFADRRAAEGWSTS